MLNQDKPAPSQQAKLTIGGGFNLLVSNLYELIITPSGGSFTNQSKVASFETWDSIPTTWASETRTWADMNLIDNLSRVTSAFTNQAKPV